ncbi:MAG: hypothetical protein ACYDHV_11135, partial [Desulfurivibrionaceae bacterium]
NVDLDTSMPTNFSTIVSFMAPILAKNAGLFALATVRVIIEKPAQRSSLNRGLDVPRGIRAAVPDQTRLTINHFSLSSKTKHTRGISQRITHAA